MKKSLFNDTRKNYIKWITTCSECRCTTNIIVEHYPHGPNKVTTCPVCGFKLEPPMISEEN